MFKQQYCTLKKVENVKKCNRCLTLDVHFLKETTVLARQQNEVRNASSSREITSTVERYNTSKLQ